MARCCSCLGRDWKTRDNMYAQLPTQQARTKRVFSSVFMVSKHMVTHLHNSATYTDDQITKHCLGKNKICLPKASCARGVNLTNSEWIKLRSCPLCMCKPSVLPTLKPHLDAESDLVTPQVGSSVTLRCEAHGVPVPEVTWYKNGLQLAAGNGLKMDHHQLEIIGVQVREKCFYVIHVWGSKQNTRKYFKDSKVAFERPPVSRLTS